jgi:translation elongation factor EF-1alpha
MGQPNWYRGPTILDELSKIESPKRTVDGLPRAVVFQLFEIRKQKKKKKKTSVNKKMLINK